MIKRVHLLLALGLSCSLVGCAGISEKNSMNVSEIAMPAFTPFSQESATAHTPAEKSAKESSESNILSGDNAESDADEPQDIKKGVSAESLPQNSPDAFDLCAYPVYPGNDAKEADNTRNPHQTAEGGNAATMNAPAPWNLENPPTLIVSTEYNADSVTAAIYSYTWTKKLDGDQMIITIACGAHPLDDPDESGYAVLYTAFPPGSLPPLPDGQFPGFMVPVFFLNFGEVPPETVTARRWPAKYVGSAYEHSADAEEVLVDMTEGFLSPLGDGEFIYEVHADWGEIGSADYVFMTLPQVRGGA